MTMRCDFDECGFVATNERGALRFCGRHAEEHDQLTAAGDAEREDAEAVAKSYFFDGGTIAKE
jgi:hypothetical protein